MSNFITKIAIYVCMFVQTQFVMIEGLLADNWRKTQYHQFDGFCFKLINVSLTKYWMWEYFSPFKPTPSDANSWFPFLPWWRNFDFFFSLSHWSRCCERLWQTWTLADLQSSQWASSLPAPDWRCSWWRKKTHTCDISHCVRVARRLPPCLHPLQPTLDLLPPQLKNFALSPHIKNA